ncbi:exopolyphosphatase [Fusarium phyllophilum]|uniref:Exopolyphosphatase n=1 Tax=Fusarium phyllophilum TaxID=47803 RepID=A0A8H5IPA3_9HYPO|nr:exopolyphosphatase [Fusarium phyllophilum]
MASRLSLGGFLAKARAALTAPAAQRKGPLTFVVGNESAGQSSTTYNSTQSQLTETDLDSLCSALVYAYMRTHTPPHTLHIPLSNLPRDDLALRTEMSAVLKHAGLILKDLITLSELPDLKPEETHWLLVDHNSLTGPLKKFSDRVTGCVDHHADENVIGKDASPRVVEPCGSCMSLVVDETRKIWEEISHLDPEDSDAATENDKLTRLALAPIISDTINLTAKEKVREKDLKAVEFLEGRFHKPFDRTAYFDEISAVKEDISDLSFRDILRKDYKEWDGSGLKLGISCVVRDFNYLVDKAGASEPLIDAFEDWAKERELDVASIMTTSHPNGEFQRHLLVWGVTDQGREAVDRFVQAGDKLKLETWKEGELDHHGHKRFAWRQKELAASRKQVAPLLREALKKS